MELARGNSREERRRSTSAWWNISPWLHLEIERDREPGATAGRSRGGPPVPGGISAPGSF